MTLDDFRRLNFREAGNWALLPKLIVLALLVLFIVALGAYFDWKDQWDTLQTAQQEEGRLKQQFTEKKAKAINYDLYVQQLADVEQAFVALVKQLPNRSSLDALLPALNPARLGPGRRFYLFLPAPPARLPGARAP